MSSLSSCLLAAPTVWGELPGPITDPCHTLWGVRAKHSIAGARQHLYGAARHYLSSQLPCCNPQPPGTPLGSFQVGWPPSMSKKLVGSSIHLKSLCLAWVTEKWNVLGPLVSQHHPVWLLRVQSSAESCLMAHKNMDQTFPIALPSSVAPFNILQPTRPLLRDQTQPRNTACYLITSQCYLIGNPRLKARPPQGGWHGHLAADGGLHPDSGPSLTRCRWTRWELIRKMAG